MRILLQRSCITSGQARRRSLYQASVVGLDGLQQLRPIARRGNVAGLESAGRVVEGVLVGLGAAGKKGGGASGLAFHQGGLHAPPHWGLVGWVVVLLGLCWGLLAG